MFEGSEKKMEVIFSPVRKPLRNKPLSFWKNLCDKANARIISHFSNSFCDSYILSESSLFVWDHRLLMLTCGDTSLVNSILRVLKKFKQSDIELLFYQRKNEFFPYKQKSSFVDDLEKMKKKINGKAYCFGVPDEHHFYLFHSEGHRYPGQPDRTIEILMYDLDDHVRDLFFKASSTMEVKNFLKLDKIFKNVQTDDYIFKPMGYSLNGLIGKEQYYTIHVTPQDPGFYVSFETNIIEEPVNEITEKVLSLFKPLAFDVIVFSSLPMEPTTDSLFEENNIQKKSGTLPAGLQAPEQILPDDLKFFTRSAYFAKNLECGYHVTFSSFFKPFQHPRAAFELFSSKRSENKGRWRYG